MGSGPLETCITPRFRAGIQGACLLNRDSLEPNLSPIRINRPWAKQAALAIAALANNSFQDDARCFHWQHLPVLLIDDVCHAFVHPVGPSAIRHHLGVKLHSTISASLIASGQNLLVTF